MRKYAVEFKGTKDGVIIFCLEDADFSEILSDLQERLQKRADFFGDADVKVDVGRRELSTEEKKALQDVIANNSRLHLSAILNSGKSKLLSASSAGRQRKNELQLEGFRENRSLVIRKTLRSGQYIRFPGDVVVMGGVNPGAEIVADGDIYVFGTLRGIAHAGAAGDKSALVVALRLVPTQLRIADVISRSPDNSTLPDQPEYAYISDQRIMIAAIPVK